MSAAEMTEKQLGRWREKYSVDPATGCWNWNAARGGGYGRIIVGRRGTQGSPGFVLGRGVMAHRVAWELHHGVPIPAQMLVRHRCDNPSCVNPEHLELGTPLDNMRDKVDRGRATRGEAVNTAKLTESEVLEIVRRHRRGETQRALAIEFGVIPNHVQKIIGGWSWSHVTGIERAA